MNKKKVFYLAIILATMFFIIFFDISTVYADSVKFERLTAEAQSDSLTYSDFTGREYFIKNGYTGQYLDVSGGIAANGTNVQQYTFNGTAAQRWYINDNGDGTYSFYTRLTNDGKTYQYALDIANGSGDNDANVHIWEINGTDAQKFKFLGSENFSHGIFTKVSDYSKAIVLAGPTLSVGGNVNQYTFQYHINEVWIFEPVSKYTKFGVQYALANVEHQVSAYPDLRDFDGDCANFVSQCMLASGIHYQNDWYIYRKGTHLTQITSLDQLNNNWDLADPSPWISAKKFANYWKGKVTYHKYKGSEISSNPSLAWNLSIGKGDVVQYAKVGLFGALGDAEHTMYITDLQNSTYYLSYHSSATTNKSLLEICRSNPDKYFIFYEMI